MTLSLRDGRVIVDYQTARLNRHDPIWTTRGAPATRAGGGSTWDVHGFGTVERRRHYLADGAVLVALTLQGETAPPTLEDLAEAIHRPSRPLFLGRKSCPPSAPLLARGPFEAPTLVGAIGDLASQAATVEVDDLDGEPEPRRRLEVADLRDWTFGFHTGSRWVREVARAEGAGEATR